LLLSGDGTNNSNNNVFVDSSTNNFSITRNGNATQGTFSPFSQTGWSNYFNGSTGYLTAPNNSNWVLGSSYTIEAWVNFSDLSGQDIICGSNSRWWLSRSLTDTGVGSGRFGFSTYSGSWNSISSTTVPVVGVWYHIAVTISSGTVSLYVSGVLEASASLTIPTDNADLLDIGTWNGGVSTYAINGHISNLRLVKGSVLYTGNSFTPSTEPLTAVTNTVLLTCGSNRFFDASTNNYTLTRNGNVSVQAFSPFPPITEYTSATVGGSAYFDGTGDWLTLAGSQNFTPGTGDWTVEGWLYSISGNWALVSGSNFYINNNGGTVYLGDASIDIIAVSPPPTGTWTHIAGTRSGSTVRLFYNGTQVGSSSSALSTATTTSMVVGGRPSQSISTNGYLSSVRIVVGTAVYTANFTPPTAPLTAITNTQLLCNFTNGGITDATAKNVLETLGDAKISTAQSKFGGSSIAFDGTGDYLVSSPTATDLYAFGGGDFTIEMWIYFNVVNTIQCVYDSRPASTQGNYPLIYLNSDGTIRLWVDSADRITSSVLSSSTWYHVAVSRSGTSTRLFINGTQSGSTYTDSTSYLNASGRPWIGINAFNTTQGLNGYIDDLRITKGIARYTSNFTAPTAAFPKSASASGPPTSVEYLVVGGGGGGGGGSVTGGYTGGGGGGAGGLQRGRIVPVNGVPITVTVGAGGGAGGTNGFGSNGTSSVFASITSLGGGGGGIGGGAYVGGTGAYGFSGGSGGGSGYRATFAGLGTAGQGRNGGSAGSGEEGSGGGGGAGAVGVNGSATPAQYTGGNGGIGIFSSISGSNTAYAGGGGAGGLGTSGYDGRGGSGGQGGGGNGSGVLGNYTTSANNANTNSGGGGGGGSRRVDGGTPGGGGSGGSGIVIIRYADTFADANSTTGTPTYTNSGGFKTYTWTGSGTITF
jgi:hypothetical protein